MARTKETARKSSVGGKNPGSKVASMSMSMSGMGVRDGAMMSKGVGVVMRKNTKIAEKEVLCNPDLLLEISKHMSNHPRLPLMRNYGKLATPEVRSTFDLLRGDYSRQGSTGSRPDPLLVLALKHMYAEMHTSVDWCNTIVEEMGVRNEHTTYDESKGGWVIEEGKLVCRDPVFPWELELKVWVDWEKYKANRRPWTSFFCERVCWFLAGRG